MREFRILQYNAGKSARRQQSLLAHPATRKYDLIAVQEPSYNPVTGGTHCAGGSGFWSVYEARGKNTRVALLVNKRLRLADWSAWQENDCIQVFRLWTPEGVLRVVNVYVAAEGGRVVLGPDSALRRVPRLLVEEEECVLLGDFNLHHPSWGGERVRRADEAARELIDMTSQRDLHLATSQGAVTWRGGRSEGTTIDLTFLSRRLFNGLIRCAPVDNANEVEDHTAVETVVAVPHLQQERVGRWSWKEMNTEAVQEDSKRLKVPSTLTSREALEEYARYVMDFVVNLSRKHGRFTHPAPWCKTWWSPEVATAVEQYKSTLRGTRDPEILWRARGERNAVVKRAKAASFRGFLRDAAEEPQTLWRMAKWGRTSSYKPVEPQVVPALRRGTEALAETFQDKVEVLREHFFPAPEPADLHDIGRGHEEINETRWVVSWDEVDSVVRGLPSRKTPGASGVPNTFLKAMGPWLVDALHQIAQACLDWEYYPKVFKVARTVALRKPGKGDYQAAKAWRPIALLETVGKVIEAVIATKIRDFAEDNQLLPDAQMGARRGRSTETAVASLLARIRAAWSADGAIASVLALDVSGAFDRVIRDRLVWVMRTKGLPRMACNWVDSFMTDRFTTLSFGGQTSEAFPVRTGIPQGSPLSPILFLFYNAELLERCAEPRRGVSCIGFVDDVKLVAWGRTIEDNCRRLQEVHTRCERWAGSYGAKFAPEKYELMHFTRRRSHCNREHPVWAGGQEVRPCTAMRFLGIWLDPKLRWKGHLDAIAGKMKSQTLALTRLSASTWGLPLVQARMVYGMVIRPAMTYGAIAWHQPRPVEETAVKSTQGLAGSLAPLQNQCLRTVAGAYRATPVSTLEAETYTAPLDLHLDSLVARTVHRLEKSGMAEKLNSACREVRRYLAAHGQFQRRHYTEFIHPRPLRRGWQSSWIRDERGPQVELRERWQRRWGARKEPWGEIHARPPDPRNLSIYKGLSKARCSILVQLRSGKTGLAAFLHRRRVPGFGSPRCECGGGAETPKHVVVHCTRFDNSRGGLVLEDGGRVDLRALLGTPKGARRLSGWWLRQNVLRQFGYARELELGRDTMEDTEEHGGNRDVGQDGV